MTPANPVVLIPARCAAARLPNKPLADIAGAPMIVHVWRRACAADCGRVVVAAADPAIAEAVQAAGGEAVLTDPDLPSGSDRIHAALAQIDAEETHDIVVNLQGDLPTLDPAFIRRVCDILTRHEADIATLAAEADSEIATNPDIVKAVVAWDKDGEEGRALDFTRAPVEDSALYEHIGLYAFRRAALEKFVALPPSPRERQENLEQLRALEAGMHIHVARVAAAPVGVDTADDLAAARRVLAAAS